MDLSDVIPAILEGGPLVIALGVAGVVIWALIRVIQALQKIIESNENQDDKRQEAADLIINNQRRLREDIEAHSERKLKEERERYDALACRVDDLETSSAEKDRTISALKKEIATLNRTVRQRDAQIAELAELIKDLTDAKDALISANSAKDKVIDKLRVELNQVKRSRAEAVSEREAKIEKLEERLAKVEQVQKNGTDKLDPKVPEEKEADDKAA